ncbi:MAG TPA: hypothetical protein VNZ55_05595 [Thermomicrobiales bacterium]|nr:hypothetical protein [Thermomicrobiales bacterium]
MIDVQQTPANADHFNRLLAFARDVLDCCAALGVHPVLSASLALFAYTRNPDLEVHDVDLSCPESHFPRLQESLRARGIDCTVTTWHVLQARRDDLKIEFDATEHWMRDIPARYERASIAGVPFTLVSLASLRELYRRGFVATADADDPATRAKHHAICAKLHAIDALQQQGESHTGNL